jgi:hypothetical protein
VIVAGERVKAHRPDRAIVLGLREEALLASMRAGAATMTIPAHIARNV